MGTRRRRLDVILVERGLAPTRERAKALILAGRVQVEGIRSDKPGREIPEDAVVVVQAPPHPYVGRGGIKLEAALKKWAIDPRGCQALDVGASTGGFTDCLLQHGAAKVVAVDVGRGQLDWSLRQDPRVEAHEGINARFLQPGSLGAPFDLAVVDVSFISLRLILPAVCPLVPRGPVLALVKPQFEVGPRQVGRGGVVRDATLWAEAVRAVARCLPALGRGVGGVIASPIRGASGNHEFFLCARPGDGLSPERLDALVEEVTRACRK
jgi:23S rRNA (cytidine1920-2'-O)/16S rRNA (cytidine1409-2'-O)-methyltransferase